MYSKFINRQKEMATLEREYGSDMSVFVMRKVYQFSIEKYTIILKKINGFLAIPQFL